MSTQKRAIACALLILFGLVAIADAMHTYSQDMIMVRSNRSSYAPTHIVRRGTLEYNLQVAIPGLVGTFFTGLGLAAAIKKPR